jgi:hypothetical protein
VNLFVVARANPFGHAYQCTTVGVSVLRFVAHTQNTHPAAEVVELSLAPLGEGVLDRLPLAIAQLAQANELVHCLLDQTLQIAGSQVE